MSFIRRFQDAIIGFTGYRNLLRREHNAFSYVAILLALVMVLNAVIETVNARADAESAATVVLQGPDFRLENGRFSFDGPMPHEMFYGGWTVIIDTTGQISPSVLPTRAPAILITEEYFYQTNAMGRVTTNALSDFGGITITRDGLAGAFRLLPNLVWILFVFIFLFQLAAKALCGWILSRVGTAYARRQGRDLPKGVAWNAAMYAMTLPILIQWVLPGFSTATSWGLVIWWSVAVLYTIGGLRAYITAEAD